MIKVRFFLGESAILNDLIISLAQKNPGARVISGFIFPGLVKKYGMFSGIDYKKYDYFWHPAL